MIRRSTVFGMLVAAVMILAQPTHAQFFTYDKTTYMTFSGPVAVPGVVLPAGTYRFHLANPESSRNVMQVLSRDGSVAYSMFHTLPDSRLKIADESTVTFRESRPDAPPAIHTLFYAGELRGYEFVYGDKLKAERHGVVATSQTTTTTKSKVEESTKTSIEEERVAKAEPPAPAPEPRAAEPEAPSAAANAEPENAAPREMPAEMNRSELPKTATPLPLIVLASFVAIFVGIAANAWRRRRVF